MLELFHHGSSACSAKVRLALAEKGLEWESRYVDILAGEQFLPEFLAVNPKAVVPVLRHDGKTVRESTVICEYVEEVFPASPLYPSDPYERSLVRIWTKAVDEELHAACSAVTYIASHRHVIQRKGGAASFEAFVGKGPAEGASARQRKWRWIQEGFDAPGAADYVRLYEGYLRRMDSTLEQTDWLVGDRLTMADVALAPYLFRLASLTMEALWEGGRLAHLARWWRRMQARPAFASAMAGWMPADLAEEMRENGRRSWPAVRSILEL